VGGTERDPATQRQIDAIVDVVHGLIGDDLVEDRLAAARAFCEHVIAEIERAPARPDAPT
jgi:hypothetical protein